VRSYIAIQHDAVWCSALAFDRFFEESLGRYDVSLGTKSKVYGVACSINCLVETGPFAADF
jgi:hypothetical protein